MSSIFKSDICLQDSSDLYEGGRLGQQHSSRSYKDEDGSDDSGENSREYLNKKAKKETEDFIRKQFEIRKQISAAKALENDPQAHLVRVKHAQSTETKVSGLKSNVRENYLNMIIEALKENTEKCKANGDRPEHDIKYKDYEEIAIDIEYKCFTANKVVTVYRYSISKEMFSIRKMTEELVLIPAIKNYVPKSRSILGGSVKYFEQKLKDLHSSASDDVKQNIAASKSKLNKSRSYKKDPKKQTNIDSFFSSKSETPSPNEDDCKQEIKLEPIDDAEPETESISDKEEVSIKKETIEHCKSELELAIVKENTLRSEFIKSEPDDVKQEPSVSSSRTSDKKAGSESKGKSEKSSSKHTRKPSTDERVSSDRKKRKASYKLEDEEHIKKTKTQDTGSSSNSSNPRRCTSDKSIPDKRKPEKCLSETGSPRSSIHKKKDNDVKASHALAKPSSQSHSHKQNPSSSSREKPNKISNIEQHIANTNSKGALARVDYEEMKKFKASVGDHVVKCLNPYYKVNIANKDIFKAVAKRISHRIYSKQLGKDECKEFVEGIFKKTKMISSDDDINVFVGE